MINSLEIKIYIKVLECFVVDIIETERRYCDITL